MTRNHCLVSSREGEARFSGQTDQQRGAQVARPRCWARPHLHRAASTGLVLGGTKLVVTYAEQEGDVAVLTSWTLRLSRASHGD